MSEYDDLARHDCPWRRVYEALDAGRPPVPEHGTRARYCRGCRCPDCRAANTDYDRRLRLGRRS